MHQNPHKQQWNGDFIEMNLENRNVIDGCLSYAVRKQSSQPMINCERMNVNTTVGFIHLSYLPTLLHEDNKCKL